MKPAIFQTTFVNFLCEIGLPSFWCGLYFGRLFKLQSFPEKKVFFSHFAECETGKQLQEAFAGLLDEVKIVLIIIIS